MNALLAAKRADTAFLCATCASDARGVGQYIVGGVGTDCICSWCRRSMTQVAYGGEVLEPLLAQHGEMTFSTSLVLDVPTRVIWDVNGYYRELGVDPHAPKAELRRAYQASVQDDRLTYIAKILLNDHTRREYDLLQLGQLWFDPWLAARVREEVLDAVQGNDITEQDVEEGTRTVRQEIHSREDQPVDLRPNPDHGLNHLTGWGHYGWKVGPREWLMARWRLMLALAARDLGVRLERAMTGVMRSPDPVGFQKTHSGTIFFIELDTIATIELATSVIVASGATAPHD